MTPAYGARVPDRFKGKTADEIVMQNTIDRLTTDLAKAKDDTHALVMLLQDAGVKSVPAAAACGTRAWSIDTTAMCERNPIHGDRVQKILASRTLAEIERSNPLPTPQEP